MQPLKKTPMGCPRWPTMCQLTVVACRAEIHNFSISLGQLSAWIFGKSDASLAPLYNSASELLCLSNFCLFSASNLSGSVLVGVLWMVQDGMPRILPEVPWASLGPLVGWSCWWSICRFDSEYYWVSGEQSSCQAAVWSFCVESYRISQPEIHVNFV